MLTLNADRIKTIEAIIENDSYSPKKYIEYNCAGYALGIYDWIYPVNPFDEEPEDIAAEFTDNAVLYEDILDAAYCGNYERATMIELVVRRLLANFKGLRVISDFSEVEKDEYGIVYVCNNTDFHFGRYDNGILSHKTGAEPPRIVCDIQEIYSTEEEDYGSGRIFFAMKKDYKMF